MKEFWEAPIVFIFYLLLIGAVIAGIHYTVKLGYRKVCDPEAGHVIPLFCPKSEIN